MCEGVREGPVMVSGSGLTIVTIVTIGQSASIVDQQTVLTTVQD